jgi:cytochrome b subunit of formate dehydrogenase
MANTPQASKTKKFTRFDILQRAQHLLFLISFSLLGLTGLPQKYPLTPVSIWYFNTIGGIEVSRTIHHTAAIVMMVVSIFHVLEVLYRVYVLRTPINMIPWINDLMDVWQDVQYYVGYKKHKAHYGRYSYAEKMEYLALVWGTIVMGITGFMMWNPISTLHLLPGEAVPAAKAAHGGEAVLAVLAIIIWHFYHVHIKTFNKSMFTGTLTREEMKHEHPAELAAIEKDTPHEPIPASVIKKRQLIYTPVSVIVVSLFLVGIYYFIGYETTALAKPILAEDAHVYVRATLTPTLIPTETPQPTETSLPSGTTDGSVPEGPTSAPAWDGQVSPIFAPKCLTCHGAGASGGLNLSTYAEAVRGGATGPLFVAGDAANSILITRFENGTHPYAKLSPEELALIAEWINAGGLEK